MPILTIILGTAALVLGLINHAMYAVIIGAVCIGIGIATAVLR